MNQWEMVLLAFYRVANGTIERVPYEELVLQAWRDFPEVFSLRNHSEHPDASDIHKKLYQNLRKDGLVVSLGNKTFRLTEKGVTRAEELISHQVESRQALLPVREPRLERTQKAYLSYARRTRTFSAWKSGRIEQLVDHDARTFFQISAATSPTDRIVRANFARDAIERALILELPDGKSLMSLYQHLITKFGDQLGLGGKS